MSGENKDRRVVDVIILRSVLYTEGLRLGVETGYPGRSNYGYPQVFIAILKHLWLSSNIYGYPQAFIAILKYLQLSRNIYCYPQAFIAILKYLSLSSSIYRYPQAFIAILKYL